MEPSNNLKNEIEEELKELNQNESGSTGGDSFFSKFKSKLKKTKHWVKENKVKSALIFGAFLITVGALGMVIFKGSDGSVDRTDLGEQPMTEEPQLTTVPSPLTGLQVKPEDAERPVTAVMIENSPDARPQSGLSKAGFVFEAIAEGGITRFVALYQETRPDPIGPVRSVRPYYLDWVMTFDAPVAHVGGSAEALDQIRNNGLRDLDQFFNADTYWRSDDRYAPHNVYTNFDKLDALNKSKGHKKSEFTPIPRKNDEPSETVKADIISVPVSSSLYDVEYNYSKRENNYKRSLGGTPHVDREGNKQIAPKVVVVMKVDNTLHSDGEHNVYNLKGSGTVHIFQDGKVKTGKWKKSSRSDMIKFVDNAGEEILLNAGMIWITAQSTSLQTTWKAE